MATTRTKHRPCPYCGKMQDAISDNPADANPRPPRAGDVALCSECLEVSILDEDLSMRRPTDAEDAEIWGDPEVRLLKAALVFLHRTRRHQNG